MKIQFLLMPLSVMYFASSINASYKTQKIIISSIPKCGTHLLGRGLELMTDRPLANLSVIASGPECVRLDKIPSTRRHEMLLDHIPYSAEAAQVLNKHGFKGFFMYRDPRDQVVSMAFWVLAHPDFYTGFGILANSFDHFPEILALLIDDVDTVYRRFTPWMQDKNFISIKFEDLIGEQGGGGSTTQTINLKKIADHIGMKLNKKRLNHVIKNLYGNTGTFREGKIGGWKNYFSDEHRKQFKIKAGKLLIDLGYETTFDW